MSVWETFVLRLPMSYVFFFQPIFVRHLKNQLPKNGYLCHFQVTLRIQVKKSREIWELASEGFSQKWFLTG